MHVVSCQQHSPGNVDFESLDIDSDGKGSSLCSEDD